MFNYKEIASLKERVNHLEEEMEILHDKVKVMENNNERFFGKERGNPWSWTTIHVDGIWDKLLDYLGIEYFEKEEKYSGFRKKKSAKKW